MLNRTAICSIIFVLFHLVGLYGFLTPGLTNLFTDLVPYHLLLMLIMLIISANDRSTGFWIFAMGVYLAGFLIEVIGVNTGLIFGSYTYGNTLGIKLWGTPLLIGVNWVILVYCTGIFIEQFKLSNRFLFSTIGALILLGIDILIEPVAIKFDYWTWIEGVIPIQNYLGWLVFSGFMIWVFSIMKFKKQNPAAIVLLIAQIVFFLVLNKWAF